MSEGARFLRQIHPNWMHDEKPASNAFLPSPKDQDKLSGYDGEKVTPEASHYHYTHTIGLKSSAVFGLAPRECSHTGRSIVPSPQPENPHHVHLDFAELHSKGAKKRVATQLRDFAVQRGVLFTGSG